MPSGVKRKPAETPPRTFRNSVGPLVAVLIFLVAIGLISPAFAHANLIRSDPPPNSVLPTSPRQVTLSFSEQLATKFSQASVLDSNGKKVDDGYSIDPKDQTIMTISVPILPSGIYTVVWKAVSAVDGHFTSGSFPFGVGNVTINVQPDQQNSQAFVLPSPLEVGNRWANYLSEAVYFGGTLFLVLAWTPAMSAKAVTAPTELDRIGKARIRKLLGVSLWVALAATIASLIIQTATIASPVSAQEFFTTSGTVIESSLFGIDWVARVGIIIALIIITWFLGTQASKRTWLVAAALSWILLLTTSLTSHNAASTLYEPALNLVSDWLHLTAVAGWVGGLVCFAMLAGNLHELRRNPTVLSELIRRFSSVAVICVGVIGMTGLYSFLLEVGSLSALFSTGYGFLLLAKIALFVPMIVLGAINQFKIFSRLSVRGGRSVSDSAGLINRFRFSVRTEVAFGLIILIIVGMLTASAPVAQTSTTPSYTPKPTVLTASSEEGVNLTLKIFPLQVGSNHFETDFSDSQGNPVGDITKVSAAFKFLDQNIGEATAPTEKSGTAQYSFDGTYLSLPGRWRVEVTAQRSQGYDIIGAFTINVPSLSLRFSELTVASQSEPYGITIDNQGLVWFAETGSGKVASYDSATGTLAEYNLPRAGSRPFYLATDNNGFVWISDTQYNLIVRFDTKVHSFTEYNVPTVGSVPGGIATDRNGGVWFTEEIAGKIGHLAPGSNKVTEIPLPSNDSIPIQIVVDRQGIVWFTESKAGRIGRVNPAGGGVDEFSPTNKTLLGPTGIVVGPDGAVWITEHAGNRITRFDPSNQTFKSFPLSDTQAFPFGLGFYQENRIWFVEHIGNAIGTLDLASGRFDTFPIPNPSSDVQLLAVDSKGNVWFTLPAIGVLGVLTQTTSGLQLTSNSSASTLQDLVLVSAGAIAVATPLVLVLGQRRMKKLAH